MVKLTLSIDDTLWPKLKMQGERVGLQGDRNPFIVKQQYDLAYGAFENALHNQLRLLVDEVLRHRKAPPTVNPNPNS